MPELIEDDKGVGSVLIGAALTSQPYLNQKSRKIRVIDEDTETPKVELPLFSMGIYRHPWGGIMKFDQDFFDEVKHNFETVDTDYAVQLNHRHGDDHGTIAFMDRDDGGVLEQRGKWMYSIAPIVDDESLTLIKKAASGRWRYTSPEIAFKYKSNQLIKMSMNEVTKLSEELVMTDKVVKFGNSEVKLTVTDDVTILESGDLEDLAGQFGNLVVQLESSKNDVQKLTDDLDKAKQEIEDLKVKLTDDKDDTDEFESLPPAVKERFLALERQNEFLMQREEENNRKARAQMVVFALESAKTYRDQDGRGHSPILLKIAEAAMLLEDFQNGDRVIKLEKADDLISVVQFNTDMWLELLKTCPGQIMLEDKGRQEDQRMTNGTGVKLSREDIEESKKKYFEDLGYPADS